MGGRRWTEKEIKLLRESVRENQERGAEREVGKPFGNLILLTEYLVGRSYAAVKMKAKRLGYRTYGVDPNVVEGNKILEEEHEEFYE